MTTARTYIIRLYRRPGSGQTRLAGLVEFVPGGCQRSFRTFEELQAILSPPVRSQSRHVGARAGSAGGALPKHR